MSPWKHRHSLITIRRFRNISSNVRMLLKNMVKGMLSLERTGKLGEANHRVLSNHPELRPHNDTADPSDPSLLD